MTTSLNNCYIISSLSRSRSGLPVGKQVPGEQEQPVAGQPTTIMHITVALAKFLVITGCSGLGFTDLLWF